MYSSDGNLGDHPGILPATRLSPLSASGSPSCFQPLSHVLTPPPASSSSMPSLLFS